LFFCLTAVPDPFGEAPLELVFLGIPRGGSQIRAIGAYQGIRKQPSQWLPCKNNRNWCRIVLLEAKRLDVEGAGLLWDDLLISRSSVIRVLHMLYERCGFDSEHCTAGRNLLMGILQSFPDNKIVEDIHNDLRRNARSHPNPVLRLAHMQDLVTNSSVLQQRNIPHPAALQKTTWISNYKSTKNKYRIKEHYGWKHKLGQKWGKILDPKSWPTVSEETGRRTATRET